ncbi:hypothetical protein IC229_22265 [Spirosoma sp. BT702]|uniref:Uncharacterized protein n=1 Tax=Spirosoma profusum TaxID=2771354 RepID=A0A926Y4M0_9BACT|nr:hypothetical protein [Spirosoma profusum]MBD2703385.1 hypothetical protein [Spirosoma profusum]
MKTRFIPILIVAILASNTGYAQSGSGGSTTTISLKGDSGTEQAAKLELIRILQERLNKLTVSQLNARIIVSRGVTDYYKVKEIMDMQDKMWAFRSRYVTQANKLEDANKGFATGGFAFKYISAFNAALSTADVVKKQLDAVIRSGTPIILPAMPTFDISPANSDPGEDVVVAMNSILSSYGINSQADFDQLPKEKQDEIKAKMQEAAKPLEDAIRQQMKDSNKQVLATLGNIVGAAFGVAGAGNMLVGLASGNTSGLSALVGSIVDNFQIPADYYDSPTLKLTDSERIKIIDELHVRISEAYQQTLALGASMSSDTKDRYKELSQPRNDVILYGPKKP